MYSVDVSVGAEKHLRRIDKRYQVLIIRSLYALREQPRLGVPLHGKLKGFWKLRVADYRIIYQIVDSRLIIYIIDIDHRKQVYR
jgi:mRNA interferase RelE/StbE